MRRAADALLADAHRLIELARQPPAGGRGQVGGAGDAREETAVAIRMPSQRMAILSVTQSSSSSSSSVTGAQRRFSKSHCAQELEEREAEGEEEGDQEVAREHRALV